MIPLSSSVVDMINRVSNFFSPKMGVMVSSAAVLGIIDTVRNRVLDWALELEKCGITGSDTNFSADEKAKAQQPNIIMNIGNIGSLVGNLGVGNVAGNIQAGTSKIADLSYSCESAA
jgi:hypothetical protein